MDDDSTQDNIEGLGMNRWNKERKRVVGLFLEWYESLNPYDRHVFECCMGSVIKQIVEDE